MSDNIKQFERGPYLSAALLCEKVLVEQDGVKSAIRIVDRVNRTAVGPNPPAEMEPFDYEIVLLLKFKSGWARGVHAVKIQTAKPSGELMPEIVNNVLFEGEEDRGVDMIGNISIKFDQTGIYWIYINLDDIRITQIPLRVTYIPQVIRVKGHGDSPSQE
jgi:hypothetical protein